MTDAKKVVLATFGTLGDIYPFIAIALALKARGLSPVLAAPEMHRRAIEGEGVAFTVLRPDERDIIMSLGVGIPGVFKIMLKNPHFILDEIYMRFLHKTYEDVMHASEGARVIITHSLLVGAHQAAEKLGLPQARVALAPLHLQSAISPSLTPSAPYILRPKSRIALHYNRIVRSVVRLSVNMRLSRLRRFRRIVGLPPTCEDFFLDFGRDNGAKAIFGLFSPHFAPAQPDQPKNLTTPGFPFYRPMDAGRRELSVDLRSFLSAGAPPIIFTLGSFAPEVSGTFYDESLCAARALGCRAILLAGTKDTARLVSRVGPDEFVCEQAPHSLLFPEGLCIVHHGGIGTTAEALRAGKPQIIVPFFGDQADHGARVERLGLGLTLKLSLYDKARAVIALRRIMSDGYGDRAARFSKLIMIEEGVEAVADWAERMAEAL